MLRRINSSATADPGAAATPVRRSGGVAALFRSGMFRSGIAAVIVRRLITSAPLLFIVSALIFLLLRAVPGDVTEAILGPRATSGLPESRYTDLAHQLGLDQPLPLQYWHWLVSALHGDLGYSLITKEPVSDLISQRFPVTLSLVIGALLASTLVGVSLGVVSAVRGGAAGRIVDVVAMTGWVVPVYWIAPELVVVFAIHLGWFPAIGYVSLSESFTGWLQSITLPVIALSIGAVGGFAKFTREAMLDALGSEYIRMARANGIAPASIIGRHAFKTGSLQVVTLAGLLTVGLLGGTVFAENAFGLPGLGSSIVDAVNLHDLPVVQGVSFFFTIIVIGVNLVVDLAYVVLSPKVRVQ
jgi:peptide/nickel transport system permease protein